MATAGSPGPPRAMGINLYYYSERVSAKMWFRRSERERSAFDVGRFGVFCRSCRPSRGWTGGWMTPPSAAAASRRAAGCASAKAGRLAPGFLPAAGACATPTAEPGTNAT